MVPLKPLVLCSLLFIWGYKDTQCKSLVKELDEESDDNDEKHIRKVADNNIDDRMLNAIASNIWNSQSNLPVEYDGINGLFKKNGKTWKAISKTFTNLFQFYNMSRGKEDPCAGQQLKKKCEEAQNNFLNGILGEQPLRILGNQPQLQIIDLKEYLKKIWFTAYRKSGGNIYDSSGFEHVFLGEINQTGHVTGLHNWMRMYEEEEVRKTFQLSGTAKFYPHPRSENIAAKVWFKWHGYGPKMSNFLMYTTPAMDIALYTLCFKVRPDQECKLQLGQTQLSVQTWAKNQRGVDLIDSAYPVF